MVKTTEQKWKESIQLHKKNCKKILDISKSIRYVGVINQFGRTLTGIIRPGVTPLWSPNEVRNEFFIIATLMSIRKTPSKSLGELDFMMLKHQKVIILAFQRKDITYYVSFNSRARGIEKTIEKITKII